jgi:CRISPR system Cascade subunit CasE
MSEQLWMVQLRLDPRHLARRHRSLPPRHEDTGYEVHGLLAALFGEGRLQPFRVLSNGAGHESRVTVLAYSRQDIELLRRYAQELATPADYAACDWGAVAAKEMPTAWGPARRLGFEVRACPVARLASDREVVGLSGATERFRAGSEVDVWLQRNFLSPRTAEGLGTEAERLGREEAYVEWLADRVAPGARLCAARLQAFRRVRLLRATHEQQRKLRISERPDALLRGELEVTDPVAFANLLATGLGRHRAYGFGMLLLRPTG